MCQRLSEKQDQRSEFMFLNNEKYLVVDLAKQ